MGYFVCCLQATERAPMMYPSKNPNVIFCSLCFLSIILVAKVKLLGLLIQIGSLLRKISSRVQATVDVADVHRTFIVFISAKLASSRKKANIGQIYQLCQNIFPKRKGCKDFGFLAVKLYV